MFVIKLVSFLEFGWGPDFRIILLHGTFRRFLSALNTAINRGLPPDTGVVLLIQRRSTGHYLLLIQNVLSNLLVVPGHVIARQPIILAHFLHHKAHFVLFRWLFGYMQLHREWLLRFNLGDLWWFLFFFLLLWCPVFLLNGIQGVHALIDVLDP